MITKNIAHTGGLGGCSLTLHRACRWLTWVSLLLPLSILGQEAKPLVLDSFDDGHPADNSHAELHWRPTFNIKSLRVVSRDELDSPVPLRTSLRTRSGKDKVLELVSDRGIVSAVGISSSSRGFRLGARRGSEVKVDLDLSFKHPPTGASTLRLGLYDPKSTDTFDHPTQSGLDDVGYRVEIPGIGGHAKMEKEFGGSGLAGTGSDRFTLYGAVGRAIAGLHTNQHHLQLRIRREKRGTEVMGYLNEQLVYIGLDSPEADDPKDSIKPIDQFRMVGIALTGCDGNAVLIDNVTISETHPPLGPVLLRYAIIGLGALGALGVLGGIWHYLRPRKTLFQV